MSEPLQWLLIGAAAATAVWLLWRTRTLWQRRPDRRVLVEDALKHIHRYRRSGTPATADSLAGALQIPQAEATALVGDLLAHDYVTRDGNRLDLTPPGETYALQVIRAHRLWEHYLAEHTGYAEAEWHARAEELEHDLTPEAANALADRLGRPTHDPHGDPIPTAGGALVGHGGIPLSRLAPGTPARIVHLEDEPPIVYAQLRAEGVTLGMLVRVEEATAERVRFWANGEEHVLAPIVADNISVLALPADERNGRGDGRGNGRGNGRSLADLAIGESAVIVGLQRGLRGAERRRLLDLGLAPGTRVTAEFPSAGGDPVAYRVRGALIALRRDQAALIGVASLPSHPQAA